ncbi:MAG: dTDP-4-dehydrorhamnose 3,5-epimerase [Chloroflexota bacterium]|nr:dTDP-4-dehydrorhamnose 3,5-epimerase [Chloroflexota bacterium]
MDPMAIAGTWTVEPCVHYDNRGSFHEWLRGADLSRALGYPFPVAQANCSVSYRGALRGIHFTDVPPGQAKYITCAAGMILDVVVDLRAGSPTFGSFDAVQLDDKNRRAVLISEGLGHAFMVLSGQATVVYLCSRPYDPRIERGVHPLDPRLGITWPEDIEPILSAKDAAAADLQEAQRAGILPSYEICLTFAARQREAARVQGHAGGTP